MAPHPPGKNRKSHEESLGHQGEGNGEPAGRPAPNEDAALGKKVASSDDAGPHAPGFCRQQEEVIDAAMRGASIFITGIAGSGKTFVLEEIIRRLKDKHGAKHVSITATTGVCASAIGGMTLHHFAGVGIEGDAEAFARQAGLGESRQRWEKCKVLVIDEVGMMDGVFFTKLENVARIVRRSKLVFGGIQLIAVGDLYQLTGIKSKWVFESEMWAKCIDLSVELSTNFRQKDAEFCEFLCRLRKNELTPFDTTRITRLNRPIEQIWTDPVSGVQVVPTKIFAKNADVNRENATQLQCLPGPSVEYTAVDSCASEWKGKPVDKKGWAPERLKLRRGAQVMLLKNISAAGGLVNGTLGVVVAFNRDWDNAPMIAIKGKQHLVTIAAEEFDHKVLGTSVVRRVQIPMRLAWATTVHKAQGTTLDCAEVDLNSVNQHGMVYVALSRVRTEQGLSVINFKPGGVVVDKKVVDFMRGVARMQGGWEGTLKRDQPVDNGPFEQDAGGWIVAKKLKAAKGGRGGPDVDDDDSFA